MSIKPLENERVLLARVANGDERVFKVLFDTYCNALGEYVFKITKSIEVSEEIVQDTFIKIWLSRSKLAEVKNFKDYLFILCKNTTVDYLRKNAREKLLLASLESNEYAAFFSDSNDTFEAYRELIERAVEKLPCKAQQVFRMSRYDRMKYSDIAAELGISPETVKKHIQIATSFIKTELKGSIDIPILFVLLSRIIE